MIVIAHRGASGYVPEHTLIAKGIAHAQGAHYLEQDLVATRDGNLVVLHDIHIDTVTDVARKFPERKREDGRFYPIDFLVDELKALRVFERFDHRTGKAVFDNRYPTGEGDFRIPTFEEEIRFITHLNQTTGRTAGIYPEIKQPAWHREQGSDPTVAVLKTLRQFDLDAKESLCFLQCFDEFEVRRIRSDLGYSGPLVQLIADDHDERSGTDYQRLKSREGLSELSEYVDAIGPSLDSLGTWDEGTFRPTRLVDDAHAFGIDVHPWTVRADQLPSGCPSLGHLVEALVALEVDGVFADHPDQVLKLLGRG